MGTSKILVVDDEPHILHVMGLKLHQAGYEVLAAADGEEALAVIEDHQPDLIITDYQMPFISGVELCERLKNLPATAHTPVLLVTAHGFGLDRTLLEQTNVAEVISKPFSPREVLTKVEALIRTQTTQQAA